MKIFGDSTSGNCLKVRYTADYLGLAYEWVEVSAQAGETRTESFLRLNPVGQVPVADLGGGRRLAQSNAIVRYLARDSALCPRDDFEAARVDEWLFWEQYSHEPYVAVCRAQMVYEGRAAAEREGWRVERAEAALDHLERALSGRDWLVGQTMSIADIALLAYTRLAPEGGFELDARPGIGAWIERGEVTLGLT